MREGIGRVIFGQKDVIDQTLITLLAGGHGLLIGVPGLAKTKLVEALGTVLGLDWKRIQFTPDLMPADITGSEVLEEADDRHRAFRFLKGPVFTQLADGRRDQPRQPAHPIRAAAVDAGAAGDGGGRRATICRMPFHVLATQNPLEQEGTYPLPEAQLDRFLLQIDVGYPDKEAEKRMLLATTFGDESAPAARLRPRSADGGASHRAAHCRSARKWSNPSCGWCARRGRKRTARRNCATSSPGDPGPRASQAFMLAARARALIDGRLCAVHRRCRGAGRTGAAPSHGAQLRRAGGRPDDHRSVIDRLCRTLL